MNNTSGGSPATMKKASKKLPAPHPPMPPSSTDFGRSLSNSDVNNVPGRSSADHSSSMIDQLPSPRIEKPKIPPPERPQMPPPDKPPTNQKPVPAKKNSGLYDDKSSLSSPLNKLPNQSDQNPAAEKPQYRLYPALPETSTADVDAVSIKTYSRQPSTGSKPPRPQPPVPPKSRDSRFSDSC